MTTPVPLPTLPRARGTLSGLVGMIVLLLAALACAAVFIHPPRSVPAAPDRDSSVSAPRTTTFSLLVLRGGQVWATDARGASRQVTKLPGEVAAQLRAAEVAPDGRLLLVTVSGGAEHAWLLDRPTAVPQPLPPPPQQYGKGR